MRTTAPLNEGWRFVRADVGLEGTREPRDTAPWEDVTLPHSWNAAADQQANRDYHRGACWYRTDLHVPELADGRRAVVEFAAAGTVADVYVGERHLGRHRGGYSAFRFDVTDALDGDGRGLLSVRVDNSPVDDVYPLMGDHTMFGGLYRPARVVTVDPVHLDLFDHAGPGVVVRQVALDDAEARLAASVRVANDGTAPDGADVVVRVLDQAGTEVSRGSAVVDLSPGGVTTVDLDLAVAEPRRWDGRHDPYLYRVVAEVRSGGGDDAVEIPLGLRTFSVDPQTGAQLNGRPYRLHGVSRHHDVNGSPAVTDADIERDMALIDEIGATVVRLAHYQHAETTLDLCDRLGLVVWAEIPFNARVSSVDPVTNAAEQLRDLIRQQRHHPSIVCWGVQNESTLSEAAADPRPTITALAAVARDEDPDRPVAQANVGHVDPSDPVNGLVDLNAANIYSGWYYGDAEQAGGMLDRLHEAHPEVPVGLSEYGADARPEYHSTAPRPGDYTEDYQAVMHETYWRLIDARPWVWASFVWNMFDFASAIRDEGGTAGFNMKGLVTRDRAVRKDAFWWYKANWSTEPVLHICAKRFVNRHEADIEVKVYANQPEVRLLVDGEDQGVRTSSDRIFRWDVRLGSGDTEVVALAGDQRDHATFRLVDAPDAAYLCPAPRIVRTGDGSGRINSWYEEAGIERDLSVYGTWTPLGELLDNPDTCAILVGLLGPGLTDHPMIEMARGIPFDMIATVAASHLDDDDLAALHARLTAVPKPAETTVS